MIPASGWDACFSAAEKDTGSIGNVLPVVAWDDDGFAMVVEPKRGGLVRARTFGNFDGIREGLEPHQILPGGGWLAEWRDSGDGSTWTEPVVAWRVFAGGWGGPLFTDSTGDVAPDESDQVVRIWHPDASAPAPADPGQDGAA